MRIGSEAKRRLEKVRTDNGLPSLEAAVVFLLDEHAGVDGPHAAPDEPAAAPPAPEAAKKKRKLNVRPALLSYADVLERHSMFEYVTGVTSEAIEVLLPVLIRLVSVFCFLLLPCSWRLMALPPQG